VNGSVEEWDEDLTLFFHDDWDDPIPYRDTFFRSTAYPMRDAWRCYKRGDIESAIHLARNIASPDWSIACTEWLMRRKHHEAGTEEVAASNS